MDSPCYHDTANQILLGDVVDFDSARGEIKLVCLPGSEVAAKHNCEETGGLLISLDTGRLLLVNLKEIDQVAFVERPPQQRLNL